MIHCSQCIGPSVVSWVLADEEHLINALHFVSKLWFPVYLHTYNTCMLLCGLHWHPGIVLLCWQSYILVLPCTVYATRSFYNQKCHFELRS